MMSEGEKYEKAVKLCGEKVAAMHRMMGMRQAIRGNQRTRDIILVRLIRYHAQTLAMDLGTLLNLNHWYDVPPVSADEVLAGMEE